MIKNLSVNEKSTLFFKMFMFFSPFFIGGFHVWISAGFTIIFCVYLLLFTLKNKFEIEVNLGATLVSLFVFSFSYLIVSLWALDSGTAIYGFIKYIPVFLFGVIVSKCTAKEKQDLRNTIPYSAIAIGIVSYVLSYVPWLADYFLVSSRLGGFFQYPNSFALYCLIGIAVILTKEKIENYQWLAVVILVAMVLLTGSRTVFVFMFISVIVLFVKTGVNNKKKMLIVFASVVLLGSVVILISGNFNTIGRFLTISFESSTFLGRLLYYKDALFEVMRKPFGLGYYGYYFSQGSFQTGVYSVVYVHNEFLQFLLDIGWLPSLFLFFVFAKSFFSVRTTFQQKIVMFLILGHSFFDFDLQFLSIFFVLILTLDFETKKITSIKLKKNIVLTTSVVLVSLSIYFALVNGLFLLNKYEQVEKLYGKDTQSQMSLMVKTDDYKEMLYYADSILKRNKNITLAYDVKANEAYENGEILSMIEYKRKAIECSLYSIEEYNDFYAKLIPVIKMYKDVGDLESALYCENVLQEIKNKLKEVELNTSPIAWKLNDKPNLRLDQVLERYIKK